jgi:hypothetical protein
MKNNRDLYADSSTSLIGSLAVTLRIGIFFDGTGNNRTNSQIGADCRAMAETYNLLHIKECGGRHLDPRSSYSNAQTNIALLADAYRQQPIASNNGRGLRAYHSLYVSGIGTTSGGRDMFLAGQSFGRGHTGVIAKVSRAAKKIHSVMRQFARTNPGCVIEVLEIDVFGFSRGAAAARHLVNEVLKKQGGIFERMMDRRTLPLSEVFTWDNNCIKIKLVGLFDTVAAVGGISDMGNVSDSVNKRVNLFLPPGCADDVIQLVAGDELRRNFSLNSISPGWTREIIVPGAHSDVGGGYPPQDHERVFLTRPRRSLVKRSTLSKTTSAWLETEAELAAMDIERWLDPRDSSASIRIACWECYRPSTGGMKEVWAAISLERTVFGHLSKVYLRLMHQMATAQGVPFESLPNDVALFSLPPELRGIAVKLIEQGLAGRIDLTEEEARVLSTRYVHRSAHWNAAVAKSYVLPDSFFVHAPAIDGRLKFPNCGQQGYPH